MDADFVVPRTGNFKDPTKYACLHRECGVVSPTFDCLNLDVETHFTHSTLDNGFRPFDSHRALYAAIDRCNPAIAAANLGPTSCRSTLTASNHRPGPSQAYPGSVQ